MGFLARITKPQQLAERGPTDDFWYGPVSSVSRSGATVNERTAFNYSAVWAASKLITETIATLPRFLFKERASGGKSKATTHPSYRVFRVEPNPETSAVNYHAMQLNFLVNWGNAFAELVRDDRGRVLQEWPIHPSRVSIKRDRQTRELVYEIRNDTGPAAPIFKRDPLTGLHNILHIPGTLGTDGVCGKGVFDCGTESIGMGLATEQYGSSYFGNGGGNAMIVLSHPSKLTPEAHDQMRASWRARYGGPDKNGSVLVLEGGTDVKRLDVPNEAAQFLETRMFNITEIARWYNLPVHMLREMSKSSFNNIEQENLHFVQVSLMPWAKRYEEERDRQVLMPADQGRFYHKFEFKGLLRGDVAARTAHYKEMFGLGFYTLDEIAELEDRDPIGGEIGETRFIMSSQYATVDSLLNPPEPPQISDENQEETPENDENGDDSEENAIDSMMQALRLEIEGRFTAELAERIGSTEEIAQRRLIEASDRLESERSAWQDRESAMQDAARAMLVDTLSRLTSKEVNAVRRAAKHPEDFLHRVDEFYEQHRGHLALALQTPCYAVRVLGMSCLSETEIANSECDTSLQELLSLAGSVSAHELLNAITALTEGWLSEKPNRIASDLLDSVPVLMGVD